MSVELFEPIAQQRQSESIFPLREDEPDYAKLSDTTSDEKNRYGDRIALYDLAEEAVSLNINGVSEKGFNPNRNKQHAFHFTADNCIGCHACESACSEKNDLAPHLSFRSVGYVEGGSYPNYQRMNISMACNHCDDPVCLKGCPTRAYTKHPEYGAVLQDPDICFGCGYCTWVCPYNAPQLDPEKGRVEKCNMCVDRLEVGLKPACVSACLGNALDFGVVENTPDNRNQIDTHLPGFPDPDITHPNIRFQQTRTLPQQLTRPDSMPVQYRRDDQAGHYKPSVDRPSGKEKHWNLGRLNSRENPLVAFTLMLQAGIGLFLLLLTGSLLPQTQAALAGTSLAQLVGLSLCAALAGGGLLLSATHLGKPLRAYRGFNNLRHSPMAREGLGAALFMLFCGAAALLTLPAQVWLQDIAPAAQALTLVTAPLRSAAMALALLAGITAMYYMIRCYLIKARPFWNHSQTSTAFVGNALSLGGLLLGALYLVVTGFTGSDTGTVLRLASASITTGLAIEGLGLALHARDMTSRDDEGAVSHYVQQTTFGNSYRLRNILLASSLAGTALWLMLPSIPGSTVVWCALAILVVLQSIVGRALFYVLVVPTTMPGAFFWKNKGFEQHARDIGLADMPQTGVASEH